MATATKSKSKGGRKSRLTKLQQWQATNLARCGGFAHRFIAQLVFAKKTLEAVQDDERACISSLLSRNQVKVTSWRNGLTPMSTSHAKGLLAPKSQSQKREAAGN